ncbi:MAG: small multi-drug export protein [Pseudomonadota bacterium]
MDQEIVAQKQNKVFKTSEGRILCAGFGLSIILIVIIGCYAFSDPVTARTLSLAFVAHTFGGRAAGIGLCIINGFSLFWTIAYNFYLEILIVFYTYSVFILSINNYIRFKWVIRYTAKVMAQAAARKDQVEKYGWIGLFLFVMAPLPLTGPVVGSIIGYLLRLNVWRNFSAVFLGTLAAIIGWVFCFDFLEAHLHIIQYVIAAIIGVVLLSYLKNIKDWFRK